MISSYRKTDAMSRLDWLVLWLLCACVLLPIWIVRYPAAADYWNHLLKARIVADYANSELNYSRYYLVSYLPIPNMAATLMLAFFMKLVPPMIAGKLLLSSYALALPLSSRYLVRSVGNRFRPLEYIGFTMVYNPCFWDGYIDFCLSVAVAQFALGYWLKMRGCARPREAAGYLGLTFLAYFTHLWGFLVLFGVTLLLAIGEPRAKRLLWAASALIAAALLFIYSTCSSERLSIWYFGATYTLSLARNFLSLPRLAGLPADPYHMMSAAALIAARLTLLIMLVSMGHRTKNRLFWIGALLVVSFFLMPNQLGRMREPGQRTLVFVPAILAAAVAAYSPKRLMRGFAALLLACVVLSVAFTARAWIAKDRDLTIYHDALAHIPAHSRVLNVVTLKSPYLKWPWKLLGSDMYRSENFFGANYNLEKGGLYLHTFTTGVVQVRDGVSPVRPWFMMDSGFEWPEWLHRNRMVVRQAFDYVVVVGPRERIDPLLLPDFMLYSRRDGVEVLKNRLANRAI